MKDEAIIMTVESVRTRASTSEALVTFALPLEQAQYVSGFMNKIGRQVGCAFADVDATTRQAPPSGNKVPPSTWRQEFAKSVFLRTPAVWFETGSDDEYLAYLRTQRCVYCGDYDYDDAHPDGVCEAAHVRKVSAGSGTSIKPEYSAVSLCHKHHEMQHQKGHNILFDDDEWQHYRVKQLKAWVWSVIKKDWGVDSMSKVEMEQVKQWAVEHNVEHFLPVSML